MKNSIFLIALGLILLTGCSKDDSIEQNEEQTINSVYLLRQFNGTATWETMILDEPLGSSNQSNGTYAHTDGYYMPATRDGMTITWSGTQYNNGARRGRAELKQISPNINFHFILETECVMVEGNEAVFGGTITQVKSLEGDVPDIGIGWRFYFKVIDFEIIGNAPFDQISNTTIFASPRSPSLCNVYLPYHRVWSSEGYTEVVRPGFVVVNN